MNSRDETRLRVLSELLSPHTVVPNWTLLQSRTGLHKATLKSSLDFLAKEEVISGFGPKVNFKQFGYRLEVLSLLQVDLAEETLFSEFLRACESNPHIYRVSSIIGSGNWNLALRHYYKDVESFHADMEAHFFKKIAGLFRLIKDRQVFFITEPHYKDVSRTNSVIALVRKERGLD